MKKANILIIICTVLSVTLLSSQPPISTYGQYSIPCMRDVILNQTSKVDSALVDTLKSYKILSDSLKIKCENHIIFIKKQQKILLEQTYTIDQLTAKN